MLMFNRIYHNTFSAFIFPFVIVKLNNPISVHIYCECENNFWNSIFSNIFYYVLAVFDHHQVNITHNTLKHTHTHSHTHSNTHKPTHTHTNTHTHTHTHTTHTHTPHTHTHTHTHVRIYTQEYIHILRHAVTYEIYSKISLLALYEYKLISSCTCI
jgi:hypothetical protein